ncbi:MAG: hypothetical protein HC828_22660 [Blastochloris sp.]|nr:hypothetical protein [Blastochloris sp.]
MSTSPTFAEKLRSGAVAVGTLVSFSDPTITELLAGSGFDYIWIDMEHGPLDIETVQAHIMAAELAGTTALVRVPQNEPVWIKRALDAGAAGIVAPMVGTAAEARQLVAACRYPPQGIRGYGPRRPARYGRAGGPDFCANANSSVLAIAQIEHIDAVDQLAEIVQTAGLDAIMIGPTDLSGSLGVLPQVGHPDVVATIERIIAITQQHQMPVGLFVGRRCRNGTVICQAGYSVGRAGRGLSAPDAGR